MDRIQQKAREQLSSTGAAVFRPVNCLTLAGSMSWTLLALCGHWLILEMATGPDKKYNLDFFVDKDD